MKKGLTYLGIVLLTAACSGLKKTSVAPPGTQPDNVYIQKFHNALVLKQKGQLEQAISAFESCLVLKPTDDAVYYALSELYLQTRQLNKSSEAIKQALKLDPKNSYYLQEYAYMTFESGNYKEAAKSFKTLSDAQPTNTDLLFSYAEALMRQGDLETAVKALDKLEAQVGLNPDLSLEKFRLYRKIKQDDKAVAEIQKALIEYPDDAQLLANLVDYYFEKKEDEKAFAYLIKLAESDPKNGNAHMALAQYYDHKGDRKKSYAELKKAFVCEDVSLDLKVKIILSMFDSQFKLDPEMFELATTLIEQYPTDPRPYAVRGDFNLKDQRNKEALADFKSALKYDKTRFAIWEQVLIMDYQDRNFTELYERSKECLEYFTAIPKVYLMFGIGANQLKKYDEAIEKLSIGEELVVNDNTMKSEIYSQKADAYFALKKYKEGQEYYEKAIKLESSNVLIKNNYAYRLGIANIELDKAERLIKQVLDASPNEAHFIDTYGWILFRKNKFEEALVQFKKALELMPNDTHIIEHVGDAQFKSGNTTEALTNWKKAKALGSTNQKLTEKIEKKTYYEPVY